MFAINGPMNVRRKRGRRLSGMDVGSVVDMLRTFRRYSDWPIYGISVKL